MVGGIVRGVLDYSAVFLNLRALWFGCKHKDFSFPQTRQIGKEKRCYVVCLKCGKEFGYDWKEMKVIEL